ncbi:MAG: hydroxysqualene dehydroxylase HpnE [Planctomycetales bacterium]
MADRKPAHPGPFPRKAGGEGDTRGGRDSTMQAFSRGRVLIVGGGLAGLACAEGLSRHGVPVTVLESRDRLGGRASSFLDRATGTLIDNCQHVSMGCCTNFARFCEETGIAPFFRREPCLHFIGPDGKTNHFAASRWPAPFHLFPALRGLSYLDLRTRRAIVRGLRALARTGPVEAGAVRFDRWLIEHDQPPEAVERFWEVVLVSALSESLDRIDAASARKVFVDAFIANRRGWEVRVPTVPLDELYGATLTERLRFRGVGIRMNAGVERVIVNGESAMGVELRDGSTISAAHVVLAVPHHRALDLLPEALRAHNALRSIAELESAPISSVHFWFDRPITDLPHAVLVGRLSQWMFNRGVTSEELPVASAECGVRNAESPEDSPRPTPHSALRTPHSRHSQLVTRRYYYQIVISASRTLRGRPQAETIAAVLAELREIWPAAREATVHHARLVTEHRAVFSATPEADRLRPPQQSPVPNLQLAGDWTRTGWPATMEGAVRSGYLAAENVLARLGRPQSLVVPDLPAALLPRLLFGLERGDRQHVHLR